MQAVLAAVLVCLGLPLAAQTISTARFAEPTDRYDHGILGDALEWGALVLALQDGTKITLRLPKSRVFEDFEPRLADVDGDGTPEVIVIETDIARGASLAIYDAKGKRTATPYIGRTHRWLAPLGAADLDGDGAIELAYIDRPHLAKTLRIWRYQNGKLTPVADLPGLTNHQIGQDYISGGIRNCGQGHEIITVNGNWSRLMASTLNNNALTTRDIGAFNGRTSFATALNCAN
ncbi:MAG: hypothetical protein ACI92Z_002163 [Paracoccaceae bacterium]|jgi:hypothetical protein